MTMVDRVIEERPADRVVVEERQTETVRDTNSNTGWIVAGVILLIIILALIFGRGMFGGGDSSTPAVNVTPTTTTGQ
jgi:hypothetical protein